MNNNELEQISDKIWCKLNHIDNQDLNKSDQIELIKPIIQEMVADATNLGRKQIINNITDQLTTLKDDN